MLVRRFPLTASLLGELNPFAVNPAFGDLGRMDLPLDVAEDNDHLVVLAELPGVGREDLRVALHDGILTISGERKEAGLPEKSRWIRSEICAGSFSRSIELPQPVAQEGISAELKDGILRIVLPKAAEARPREIRVN